jgi:hypothetical protein
VPPTLKVGVSVVFPEPCQLSAFSVPEAMIAGAPPVMLLS